jgi:hypothetical protein
VHRWLGLYTTGSGWQDCGGLEKGSTGNGREVVGYAEGQGRCAAVVGAQMWGKEYIEKLISLPI